MVILAQVSDLHIDGSEERGARAGRVMRYLATLPRPVDAVLVTGDVADHGAVEGGPQAAAGAVAGAAVPWKP
jgi:Icc protein